MRIINITVVGLIAIMGGVAPALGGDGFNLRLHTQVIVADQTLHLFDPATLKLRSEHDFRRAIWESPMSQLHLQSAVLQGELGHIGEVHGGRYNQFNVTLDALGAAPGGGLETGRLFDREYWNGMSQPEQVRVGVQAAVTAGILAFIIDGMS
jgi:hypothetical protein